MKLDWMVAWSLDAPLVLLAYFWGLSRVIGEDVPLRIYGMLGVGIWLGYMADRIFDVVRRPEITVKSERHRRVGARKWFWISLWSLVVVSLIGTGYDHLDTRVYFRGWCLASGAALYVFLGSLIRGQGMAKELKKASAAALLSLTPWVFMADQMTLEAGAFSALFFLFAHLNLRMIDLGRWGHGWKVTTRWCFILLAGGLGWVVGPVPMVVTLVLCGFYWRLGEMELFRESPNKRWMLDGGLLVYCLLIGGIH